MRTTTLLIVLTVAPIWAATMSTASAQVYQPGTTSTIPPDVRWGGYPPTSPWQGYAPGLPWAGYAPPSAVTTTPPALATTPGQPTGAVRYQVATTSGVGTATAPSFTSRAAVAPSFYREYGSGRNIYMHKPWLPGQ